MQLVAYCDHLFCCRCLTEVSKPFQTDVSWFPYPTPSSNKWKLQLYPGEQLTPHNRAHIADAHKHHHHMYQLLLFWAQLFKAGLS